MSKIVSYPIGIVIGMSAALMLDVRLMLALVVASAILVAVRNLKIK